MRGNDWGELGIGITDAIAARRRLGEKDGLQRQHRWSVGYLDSRILGQFVFLSAMASIFLGLLLGPWAGSALFAAVLIAVFASYGWRQRRRSRLREAQVAAHLGRRDRPALGAEPPPARRARPADERGEPLPG